MSVSINMRPGHKKKFTSPGFMQQAKEEMGKLEEKSKREEEELEKKRKREEEQMEEKRKREEEELEDQRNREKAKQKREEAKREREEAEEEEQQKREKELAHELSEIERKRILNEAKDKARSNRDAADLEHEGAKSTAPDSTKPTTAKNTASKPAQLPACKDYAAFISHKKMHTEFADSSETLSIRLKVHVCWHVLPL